MKKNLFSFLFNTVFYSGIPKETIRMPFRGLTMLKSRKLVIKGGLCYRFAMVLSLAIFSLNTASNCCKFLLFDLLYFPTTQNTCGQGLVGV